MQVAVALSPAGQWQDLLTARTPSLRRPGTKDKPTDRKIQVIAILENVTVLLAVKRVLQGSHIKVLIPDLHDERCLHAILS